MADSICKKVILQELEEQTHVERVEDVIFWALEFYAKNKEGNTLGKAVAYSIVENIKEEESKFDTKRIVKILKTR